MNSKQIKLAMVSILGAGALTLSLMGAQAQVFSTPYGNLPYGVNPVRLSPSAPYLTNPYNLNTQDYSVFGGSNGSAAFPVGPLNNGYGYGYYGLGGSTSPMASAAYFGYGLPTAFAGYPYGYAITGIGPFNAGSNISVADGPLSGGFALVNPNGAYFVGPNGQPADPTLLNGGTIGPVYGRKGGITGIYGRKASNAGAQPDNGMEANTAEMSQASLQQLISTRQDANFNLHINWLGDPAMIAAMNVTLLNQYHLPVVSSGTFNGTPVTFAANRDVYSARYYRANIQFTNGEVATVTGRIRRK